MVFMLVICVEKELEFVSNTHACLFFIDLFLVYISILIQNLQSRTIRRSKKKNLTRSFKQFYFQISVVALLIGQIHQIIQFPF